MKKLLLILLFTGSIYAQDMYGLVATPANLYGYAYKDSNNTFNGTTVFTEVVTFGQSANFNSVANFNNTTNFNNTADFTGTVTLPKDILTSANDDGMITSFTGDTVTGTKQTGVITTSHFTDAVYQTHLVQLTNALITPSSVIVATVSDGTNAGGVAIIRKQDVQNGFVQWTIFNSPDGLAPNSFNGTLKINYIINP